MVKARTTSLAKVSSFVVCKNKSTASAILLYDFAKGVINNKPLWKRFENQLPASPILFPEEMWIQGPNDWSFNLPFGKYYDTTEYAFQQCAVTKEHSIPLNVFMKSIIPIYFIYFSPISGFTT